MWDNIFHTSCAYQMFHRRKSLKAPLVVLLNYNKQTYFATIQLVITVSTMK